MRAVEADSPAESGGHTAGNAFHVNLTPNSPGSVWRSDPFPLGISGNFKAAQDQAQTLSDR